MYATIKNINNYKINDITKELNQFREILDSTMKELREKIYGLSWKKSGSNSFSIDIKKYIEDVKKLNQVSIPFSIHGNMEILSTEQKKALYRMICEGIGNAVRHGKAKNIEIILDISADRIFLSISDDGTGFDLKRVMDDSTKGLGIHNLNYLTEILRGEINIESQSGRGTTLEILLPNVILKGEAVI
jgi:signal transduction histidine kinase